MLSLNAVILDAERMTLEQQVVLVSKTLFPDFHDLHDTSLASLAVRHINNAQKV